MLRFLVRRGVQMVLTMLALVLLTFVIIRAAPGGPAQALLGPDEVSPEQIRAVETRLGLDHPMTTQVLKWVASVARGDLGTSYFYRQSAVQVVRDRLPATVLLGGGAMLLAIALGVPAGCWAALHRHSPIDPAVRGISVGIMSIPVFWVGIALIYLFSVRLGALPSSGTRPAVGEATLHQRIEHLILPLVTMALPIAATLTLFTRNAMLDVLGTDYLRTARAKGLSNRTVIRGHALRNAAIPIIMQVGLTLPHVVEGSIIVETVFSWPGIGQLTTASVGRRDYPVLLVVSLLIGFGVLISSMLSDLAQKLADPRVELS